MRGILFGLNAIGLIDNGIFACLGGPLAVLNGFIAGANLVCCIWLVADR